MSLLHQAELTEAQRWGHAVRAADVEGRQVTGVLFIQSPDDLSDTSGTGNTPPDRQSAGNRVFLNVLN